MAHVVVSAAAVLNAIPVARARLQPGPNAYRSEWARQETMLNEMQTIATAAAAFRPGLVGISLQEARLIEQDLATTP